MTHTAEILSVGTELLLGNIANTDAQDVSVALSELGIDVRWHTVVGDNPERVKQAVAVARTRADIAEFARAFPDVYEQARGNPKGIIPADVWKAVDSGMSLGLVWECRQRALEVYHLAFGVVDDLHALHPSGEWVRLQCPFGHPLAGRPCHLAAVVEHHHRPLAAVLPD